MRYNVEIEMLSQLWDKSQLWHKMSQLWGQT